MAALTEFQKLRIGWELGKLKAYRQSMPKTFDVANERLNKLTEKGLYLEMVLIHSQVIEHYIRQILYGYEIREEILKILGDKDAGSFTKWKDVDDAPLGQLIGFLGKCLGRKNPMIAKLTLFNDSFRTEVMHHIFDGSRDVTAFDEQIKEYFNREGENPPYKELVDMLSKALKEVDDQIKELTKDVHSAGVEPTNAK